jgi:hypothetical protein
MAHDPRGRRNALDIFTYINVNCSPRNQLPHEHWPQGIRKLLNDYFHFFKTSITTEIYIKKAEIRKNNRILDVPKRQLYSRLTGEITYNENHGILAKITADHQQLVAFLREEELRAHNMSEEQLEKIKATIPEEQMDSLTAWLFPREEEMLRATKHVIQLLAQNPTDFVQTRTYAQAARSAIQHGSPPRQNARRNQHQQQHQQPQQHQTRNTQTRQPHNRQHQNDQNQNRQHQNRQQQNRQQQNRQQQNQQQTNAQPNQQHQSHHQRHRNIEQTAQQPQQHMELQELYNIVQSLVTEVREIKATTMRSASRSLPGQNIRQNDPYGQQNMICPPSEDGSISPRKRDRTTYIPETPNGAQQRLPVPPSSDF